MRYRVFSQTLPTKDESVFIANLEGQVWRAETKEAAKILLRDMQVQQEYCGLPPVASQPFALPFFPPPPFSGLMPPPFSGPTSPPFGRPPHPFAGPPPAVGGPVPPSEVPPPFYYKAPPFGGPLPSCACPPPSFGGPPFFYSPPPFPYPPARLETQIWHMQITIFLTQDKMKYVAPWRHNQASSIFKWDYDKHQRQGPQFTIEKRV